MAQWSEFDRLMMAHAIEIARSGRGYTLSNPRVGAVITVNGQIVAGGYHQRYGEPHAERNAIAEANRKGIDLHNATLYVTLEPCCHQGKTGPCTEAVIEAGIQRVVIGSLDPNPKVNGHGVERLQRNGIAVEVGLLQSECQALNPAFITYHTLHRPYVLLKWAQSVDGFIDIKRSPETPAPWFTGNHGRMLVHRWRSEHMAILVGANTVLRDNPQLSVRAWVGPQPLRVIVDRDLSLPRSAHIFDGSQPTLLLTNSNLVDTPAWRERQAVRQLELAPIDRRGSLPENVLAELYGRGVNSLLVEGGAKTIEQFMASSLWDEARIFIAPICVGDGIKAPQLPKGASRPSLVGASTLLQIDNPHASALECTNHA